MDRGKLFGMETELSVDAEQIQIAQALLEHSHHRFAAVAYQGEAWDLSHLDPFAFHRDIGTGLRVEVVVIFSCHCFTHGIDKDKRDVVPADDKFCMESEVRVLNPQRYALSRSVLIPLIRSLDRRKIIVAAPGDNYATFEITTDTGETAHYGVFFTVTKARTRKKRLILRVQSAYLREPTARQRETKKVGFDTLLRAAYHGTRIRP